MEVSGNKCEDTRQKRRKTNVCVRERKRETERFRECEQHRDRQRCGEEMV